MGVQEILYENTEGVATITLNRPDKLNAWTRVMEREVREAMVWATEDDAVRVIVLTGAGRGFCAGADMSLLSGIQDDGGERHFEVETGPIPGGLALPEDFSRRYSYFPTVPKPIIGALNGPVAGLGMVMALYTDIRLASESVMFTTAFSRRGLIAEHGISWMLPQLIGLQGALDLLLSARKVTAAEALRLGLVSQVFPEESFRDEVHAYAREIATLASPRSMRVMKSQLYKAQFQSLGQATETADDEMVGSFDSEDFKEGVAHFLEKRAPAFTGR
jgi:enoyl-CoA hydratase/carnithine racemase